MKHTLSSGHTIDIASISTLTNALGTSFAALYRIGRNHDVDSKLLSDALCALARQTVLECHANTFKLLASTMRGGNNAEEIKLVVADLGLFILDLTRTESQQRKNIVENFFKTYLKSASEPADARPPNT